MQRKPVSLSKGNGEIEHPSSYQTCPQKVYLVTATATSTLITVCPLQAVQRDPSSS